MSVDLNQLKTDILNSELVNQQHILTVIDALIEYEQGLIDMESINALNRNTNLYQLYPVSQSMGSDPVMGLPVESSATSSQHTAPFTIVDAGGGSFNIFNNNLTEIAQDMLQTMGYTSSLQTEFSHQYKLSMKILGDNAPTITIPNCTIYQMEQDPLTNYITVTMPSGLMNGYIYYRLQL